MNEKVLCVSKITKTIKKHVIFKDISFEISKGEIVGFVGPNGAGKSSILKALSHFIHIDSGKIFFENRLVSGVNNKEYNHFVKETGLVLNDKMLCSNMTGYHNLKNIQLLYDNISDEDIEKTIDLFEMRTYIKKRCNTYSYGMKQRIVLALAYLKNPSIYLLDEPTNGLDPDGIRLLKKILMSEAQEKNKSILISSHLLHDLVDCCDRIIFIKNGKIANISNTCDIREDNGGIESIYFEHMGEEAY